MVATRHVFFVALASCIAGAALMFAYVSPALQSHGPLGATAAIALFQNAPTSPFPAAAASTTADTTNAASTTASTTPLADQSQAATSAIQSHQFRLLFNVDMCTFNTLGKDGWQPVQFGQATDNNDYLEVSGGRDENCQSIRATRTFIWVLFERDSS